MAAKRRRIFGYFLLFLIAASGAFFAWFFLTRTPERHIFGFVPTDAVYILESKEPVTNWREFSGSKIWKFLRKNPVMKEYDLEADSLDQLLQRNEGLMKLVGNRTLLISAHLQAGNPDGWDFLYLFDLEKGAKVSVFKDVVFDVLQKTGSAYETYNKNGFELFVIRDPQDGDLFLSFVDNILIISYTEALVIRSREQGKQAGLNLDHKFLRIEQQTGSEGEFRLFLNYSMLDDYLALYLDSVGPSLGDLSRSLKFSGLDIQMEEDFASFSGFTNILDSIHSMTGIMLLVEGSDISGDAILPPETSFFIRLGFSDFSKLYDKIWENFEYDEKSWKEAKADTAMISDKLKVNFKHDLTSWIGNEMIMGMLPLEGGKKQAYFGVFQTNNRNDAEKKLDFVTRQLSKKAKIIKVRISNYKGYEIRYIDIKGFFKIFFGGLWNKYEKPHYFLMKDYVIFSNDTSALHRFIDAEDAGESLAEDETYRQLRSKFDRESNFFGYINNRAIYAWLQEKGDPGMKETLTIHQNTIQAFGPIGFQLNQEREMYQTDFRVLFRPPNPQP